MSGDNTIGWGRRAFYISGPMAGYPENNFPAFQHALDTLSSWGWSVLSPHTIDHGDTTEWADFLRRDIQVMLDRCCGLILLQGWPESRGARMELSTALALDWPVYFFDGRALIAMSRAGA